MLYYTVPSIVKKDIKSPGLHYGWHLQIKSIFYTKNPDKKQRTKPQNQETICTDNNKTTEPDYWSKNFYSRISIQIYSTRSCKTSKKLFLPEVSHQYFLSLAIFTKSSNLQSYLILTVKKFSPNPLPSHSTNPTYCSITY